MNIPIHETLREAHYDVSSSLLTGVILQSGLSKNGNYYTDETIESAAGKFTGLKCFIDHSSSGAPGERSIRDVCGVVEECRAESGKLKAVIRVSKEHDWIASMVKEGILGDVSINALGKTRLTRRDGKVVREVTEISRAYSVDFVTDAAAGGRVEALLRESAGYAEGLRLIENMTHIELAESRPDLIEKIEAEVIAASRSEPEDLESSKHLVEGILAERKLPSAISSYLSNILSRTSASNEEIHGLIEDHLNYLGGLTGLGMIRGVSEVDPIEKGSEQERESTFRFLGVG